MGFLALGMCYVLLLANGNAHFERDGGPAQVLLGVIFKCLTSLAKAPGPSSCMCMSPKLSLECDTGRADMAWQGLRRT